MVDVGVLLYQAAKAALKQAAGALAEALAERNAAGEERGSIEAQLQAALKTVTGKHNYFRDNAKLQIHVHAMLQQQQQSLHSRAEHA